MGQERSECSEDEDGAREVRTDVLTYGWHVAGATADAGAPAWRYTVGLHRTHQHPEVVVSGLSHEVTEALLAAVVRHVRAGTRFEAGDAYDGILERYACAFRAVDRRWYTLYLPHAVAFYGGTRFPALQCLWPDRLGRFPWERGCDPAVRAAQACLFPSAAGTPPSGGV